MTRKDPSLTILQISDTHLHAAADSRMRGVTTYSTFLAVLEQAQRDPRWPVDAILATGDIVQDELTLIEQAGGIFTSPLFDLDEDYSQYKPRGHYTRNETYGRYFRAMMWYGRMPFTLHSDNENVARLATRQA